MGFSTGSYATVWEVKPSEKYTDVRLSTSKKNQQTGEYTQSFGGYVRFIGTAHNLAKNLKPRDRIKIGNCDVTNNRDNEKNITYYNFAVFSFEDANNKQDGATSHTPSSKPKAEDFMKVPDGIEDELPFE